MRDTILIDITFLKNCGSILAHTYKRLKKVNIKDKDSFLNAIDKVLGKKIKVKFDFDNYFSKKIDTLKPKNLEMLNYFKNIRKDYVICPEIIYLMNFFSRIKKAIIDINIFSQDFDIIQYYYFIICILNFPYIFIKANTIKLSTINEEMLEKIYEINEADLINSKEFFSFKNNKKIEIKTKSDKLYKKEESFLNEFKLMSMEKKINKNMTIVGRKSLPSSKIIEIEKIREKEFKSNKNLVKINSENIPFSPKKQKINHIFFKKISKFKDRENSDNISLDDKVLEMIIITFLSFKKFENIENLELILVDTYYSEFISYFRKNIKIKIENFHMLDLIYNKLLELKSLNIEINSFDLITFNGLLSILYKIIIFH